MMNKAASLSSSLLVRKGAAEPSRFGPPVAYESKGFPGFDGPPFGDADASGAATPALAKATEQETGGASFEPLPPAAAATVPVRIGETPVADAVPAAAPGKPKTPAPTTRAGGRRIRHSLRLDTARHRRLKLLSAHTGRSLQDILTEALDNWMNGHAKDAGRDGCACLATGGCDDTGTPDGPAGPVS